MKKLTREERGENINITAGRIVWLVRLSEDKRLKLLAEKLLKDLRRLKVYDEERE